MHSSKGMILGLNGKISTIFLLVGMKFSAHNGDSARNIHSLKKIAAVEIRILNNAEEPISSRNIQV